MRTFRFFDEGSGETLKIVKSNTELSGRFIENMIMHLEEMTSCYVLWEEMK